MIVRNSFALLQKHRWKTALVKSYAELLKDVPLKPQKVENSDAASPSDVVSICVIRSYLPELFAVLGVENDKRRISHAKLMILLHPFFNVVACSANSQWIQLTIEHVFVPITTDLSKPLSNRELQLLDATEIEAILTKLVRVSTKPKNRSVLEQLRQQFHSPIGTDQGQASLQLLRKRARNKRKRRTQNEPKLSENGTTTIEGKKLKTREQTSTSLTPSNPFSDQQLPSADCPSTQQTALAQPPTNPEIIASESKEKQSIQSNKKKRKRKRRNKTSQSQSTLQVIEHSQQQALPVNGVDTEEYEKESIEKGILSDFRESKTGESLTEILPVAEEGRAIETVESMQREMGKKEANLPNEDEQVVPTEETVEKGQPENGVAVLRQEAITNSEAIPDQNRRKKRKKKRAKVAKETDGTLEMQTTSTPSHRRPNRKVGHISWQLAANTSIVFSRTEPPTNNPSILPLSQKPAFSILKDTPPTPYDPKNLQKQRLELQQRLQRSLMGLRTGQRGKRKTFGGGAFKSHRMWM